MLFMLFLIRYERAPSYVPCKGGYVRYWVHAMMHDAWSTILKFVEEHHQQRPPHFLQLYYRTETTISHGNQCIRPKIKARFHKI